MCLRRLIVFGFLILLSPYVRAQEYSLESAARYLQRAMSEPDEEESGYFYQKALDQYCQCFDSMPAEQIAEEDYWDAASCAVGLKNYESLTSLMRLALSRSASQNGVDSEQYAYSLQQAAIKCMIAKDNWQAKRFLGQSDKLFRKFGDGPRKGRNMAQWREAVTIRANLCWRETRHTDALRYAERLVREESKLENNDENYYRALLLASNIASDNFKPRKASKYSKEAFYIATPMVVMAFNYMSEAARDRYWRKTKEDLEGEDIPRFDYLLLSKGILLKASQDFNDLVINHGDSLAVQMLSDLNAATIAGAPADTLEAKDERLVAHLQSLGILDTVTPILANQGQIKEAINDDDLVIEFYVSRGGGYGAALLKKDWQDAKYVLCGELVYRYSQETLPAWPNNIIKHFPSTRNGRVFFSADGELNNIGIEYYSFKKEGIISDLFPVYRLSSTREIIPDEQNSSSRTAGLYGGALYDLRFKQRQRMLDSLKTRTPRNVDRSVLTLPKADDAYSGLKPLPQSLVEVEAIDSIMRYAGLSVDIQTGTYASEDYFKSFSSEEQYLHLATHGFYVKASELDRHPYYAGLFGSSLESISLDPMLRTGLYLSGANQSLMGVSGSYEDGILTAKEISLMDLRNVELVVLSACETGLGENGTDGAYGLQRAFKKAGVHSIVMTLRKIDDSSAAFFMRALYENRYLLGLSLHDAFYSAIRSLREWEQARGAAQDWNSIILLDAYSPL